MVRIIVCKGVHKIGIFPHPSHLVLHESFCRFIFFSELVVNITAEPAFPLEGQDVVLTCTVEHGAKYNLTGAVYTWYHIGYIIRFGGYVTETDCSDLDYNNCRQITISYVDWYHSGMYACTAVNYQILMLVTANHMCDDLSILL